MSLADVTRPLAVTVSWLLLAPVAPPIFMKLTEFHSEFEPVTRAVFPLLPKPTALLLEFETWPPLLTMSPLPDPLLPTVRVPTMDHREPVSVMVAVLPLPPAPAPIVPPTADATWPPLAIVSWLFAPLLPTRISSLLQTEPGPVTSAELLLAPEEEPMKAERPAKVWLTTFPPLLMTRLLLAPLLPRKK